MSKKIQATIVEQSEQPLVHIYVTTDVNIPGRIVLDSGSKAHI